MSLIFKLEQNPIGKNWVAKSSVIENGKIKYRFSNEFNLFAETKQALDNKLTSLLMAGELTQFSILNS